MILILCIVSGCQATTNYLYKNININQIEVVNHNQITEMIENDRSFILYIGRNDCFDCNEFKPYLEQFLLDNPGVYLYELDIKDMYYDDDDTVLNEFKEMLEFDWTPSLRFVYEGVIIDSYQYLDKAHYALDSKEKRENSQKKFIEEFYNWMNTKYK